MRTGIANLERQEMDEKKEGTKSPIWRLLIGRSSRFLTRIGKFKK